LVKDLTEIALQREMDAYLQENSSEEGGNCRNGFKKKTVKGSGGSFELEVPRDRSSFEPQIVKKRQTVLNNVKL
jgi:putative transposase